MYKYRKYDAIIMPQVIPTKTFYTSKSTSFFTFFKRTSGLYKKNLSNQLSNCSTNLISVTELSNWSSRQNPQLLIKKSSVFHIRASCSTLGCPILY